MWLNLWDMWIWFCFVDRDSSRRISHSYRQWRCCRHSIDNTIITGQRSHRCPSRRAKLLAYVRPLKNVVISKDFHGFFGHCQQAPRYTTCFTTMNVFSERERWWLFTLVTIMNYISYWRTTNSAKTPTWNYKQYGSKPTITRQNA